MANYLDKTGLQYFWNKIKAYVTGEATANRTMSIPMGELDSTSTSTVMTAQVDGITELKDGVCVYLYNGVVASAKNFTININNLGAKPVYQSMSAATRAETIFTKGRAIIFVYNSTRVDGGCWDYYIGTDSNDNYLAYRIRRGYGTYTPVTQLGRYKILLTYSETQLLPTTAVLNSTATNKALTELEFNPFGAIYYYATTTTVNAGSYISASYLYSQYEAIDLRQSFNTGTTLTAHKDIYIVAAPQSNGKAKLASTPITQTLPTSEDGLIYIYLGRAYDTYRIQLDYSHPIYYYKDGAIRIWTNPEAIDNEVKNTKGVKFFAHRGLTNNSTENTLNAFVEAYNKGYRSFETDVRVTKDNIPILNHNATLGGYTIASTNYSVLASAATSAGYTLAKLEDYLKLANVLKFDNTVLELKTENTVANCTLISTLVKQYQMSERIIFNVKGVTANANAVRAVIPTAMLLTHYDSATTLNTFSTYKVNGKVIFSILPSEIGSTITQSAMYNLMSEGYGVYLVPSTTAELTNSINIGSQYIEIEDGYKNTLELDEFVSDATGCISPFKYKSGESFVIGQQMCAGQLTSSSKNIYFTITCPKQIPSGLSISLSGAVNIRHPDGNLAAGQEINNIGALSIANVSGNMIYVLITLSTASSLANNRPLTVQLGAGFTVSFS